MLTRHQLVVAKRTLYRVRRGLESGLSQAATPEAARRVADMLAGLEMALAVLDAVGDGLAADGELDVEEASNAN